MPLEGVGTPAKIGMHQCKLPHVIRYKIGWLSTILSKCQTTAAGAVSVYIIYLNNYI